MQIKDLQMKRALRTALLVLLLSVAGMTDVFSQTQGMLNGKFTVDSNGKQVRFSQGNLQYRATTNTMRFAENQWDYVGNASNGTVFENGEKCNNANISSSYSGWIDLFGWGTSGWDNGNTYYYPWNYQRARYVGQQCGYGPTDGTTSSFQYYNGTGYLYSLSGDYDKADWGVYNPILNGGNQQNQWRTLTQSEWDYVLFTRSTPSGKRFAKARVNGINGVILLPDDWNNNYYSLSYINQSEASYESNLLPLYAWNSLEYYGAVFLPAAGNRTKSVAVNSSLSINYTGSNGYYWTTTHNGGDNAYCLFFDDDTLDSNNSMVRCSGFSVRLVRDVKNTIGIMVNPAEGGTVSGGGTYDLGVTCTLTATANSGYIFTNWTENGTVISTSTTYSFIVTGDRNIVANFNLNSYNISILTSPMTGGIVFGGGTYVYGTTCNLIAVANSGYSFTNWTENGVVVSADLNYSFTVTSNRTIVANFTAIPQYYIISASANPSNCGSVTGSGTYLGGATCILTASANMGYTFANWTENGAVVSTNANYSFTVTSDRTLIANFSLNNYNISVMTNPSTGGAIIGGGTYAYGTTCNLTATTNNGYLFTNWTENGEVVSTDASYSFPVTGDRSLVANFELCSYSITAMANPEVGGAVTGSGLYHYGDNCTLVSAVNEGYTFINWMKGSDVVSTDVTYSFTVTESGEYVANFELINYEITTEANPIEGGFVTGGGTYAYGSTCTISAVANVDYVFSNWTENGAVVSTNATYSFIVSLNRDLVANFSYIGSGGLLDGMFSISNGKKVCFSQGNLQYQASTDTWRFADNQWDWIGGTVQGVHYGNVDNSSNSNISSAYDGWIDLFGWGTSGWDNGNTCYHPWDINSDNDGTLFGPPGLNSLVGDNANADWGVYNPISNGGGQANQWRTLTYWEWNYLLNTRTTSSGVRYAKAQLNGVNGLILVPDNWDASVYELQNVNTSDSSFDSNVLGLTVWINTFESNGAVFLPAAGARIYGTTMFYLNDRGYYWSSTCHGNLDNYAIDWGFSDEGLNYFAGNRSTGMSVRLVRDVVTQTVNLSAGWNWISLYVELEDPIEALQMLEAALGDNATVISASEMYTEYYGSGFWIGDLDEVGITNEQMYMVEVVNDCEVTLEGTIANPADHAITINPGWNWIGFPCGQELNLEDALADFEAEDGDQLTEAELYTEYGFGDWIGDIETLVPGRGYMYFSNSTQPKTLVFSTTTKLCKKKNP